jgi:signal transduction histidine kinase
LRGTIADDVRTVGRIAAAPGILEVVCRITGMRFAAIARVTETSWTACAVRDEIAFGLIPGSELEISTTICSEVRDSGQAVVIDHVDDDPAFCGHPTPKMYGFQSYISMPIRLADGTFFGTLCAIDPEPARVSTPETREMFRLFAELIAFHVDAQERFERSEAALLTEREAAELREQFIAVLGHDLRNPLASVHAGVEMILRSGPEPKVAGIARLMQASCNRMVALTNNLLDFARGRLGGGLSLNRGTGARIEEAIEHVLAETRAAHPGRAIEADLGMESPVEGDADRIAQLLSNLLANALTHGAPGGVVSVRAKTEDGMLRLSVSNGGAAIAEEKRSRLFEPFSHSAEDAPQGGLGLGLYIAAEIARAHLGRIDVTSTADQTRFTFEMPLVQASARLIGGQGA